MSEENVELARAAVDVLVSPSSTAVTRPALPHLP
jgi:hypothetical protein